MALAHIDFYSPALGHNTQIDAILPEAVSGIGVDGAENSWPAEEDLPVLYLLHGTTDDQTIWQRRTAIERYASGRKLIIIMPNGQLSAYSDQVYGEKVFTYLTEELPATCHRLFRASAAREKTFIAGLSMGGYGALKAGMVCPEKYAAVAALSGGVDRMSLLPRKFHGIASIAEAEGVKSTATPEEYQRLIQFCLNFGSPAALKNDDRNELFLATRRAAASGKTLPALHISCGTEDPISYEPNCRYRALLDELGIPYVYEEKPGVHEWAVWDHYIQRILDWLPIEG